MSASHDILLAIETSQSEGGVALRDRDGAVRVEMLRKTGRHDDDLLPAIDRVMRQANLRPNELQAVGVSIGPGGFTGLRIAATTAKMFAETLGVQIAAVPSALVCAEPIDLAEPIAVALAGKRETCWLAPLRRDKNGFWELTADAEIVDANSFVSDRYAAIVADRYLPEAMRERCGEANVPVLEPTFNPAACLAVADRMLQRGKFADALSLMPLYPREPEAVTIWRERDAADKSDAARRSDR